MTLRKLTLLLLWLFVYKTSSWSCRTIELYGARSDEMREIFNCRCRWGSDKHCVWRPLDELLSPDRMSVSVWFSLSYLFTGFWARSWSLSFNKHTNDFAAGFRSKVSSTVVPTSLRTIQFYRQLPTSVAFVHFCTLISSHNSIALHLIAFQAIVWIYIEISLQVNAIELPSNPPS